jgi:hypothetical protein
MFALLLLTGTLLCGCAGVYVAGDTGAHHDSDRLTGGGVGAGSAKSGSQGPNSIS